MTDYESMYYTLLKACERAIEQLERAHPASREHLHSHSDDYFEAYSFMINASYSVRDMLLAAERQSEDIYIATCSPDLTPDDGPSLSPKS